MDVDEDSAKWVSEYKGKKYYFCAPDAKNSSKKTLKNTPNNCNLERIEESFIPLFFFEIFFL